MCKDCFYTKTQEPYEYLLKRRAWKAKREIILARDNHRCTRCGKKESEEVSLHVHHKHYIIGLDPWEYKDSELVTLCEECHKIVHAAEDVPVFILEDGMLKKRTLTACSRCAGAGYFPEYSHVQGGVCFRCHGARYDEYIEVYEKYAKEHNIDISTIDYGFAPLDEETRKRILEVQVHQSMYNPDRLYLKVLFQDNKYANAYLDFSVKAEDGDKLKVETLRYKEYKKAGSDKPGVILTGKIIHAA